MAVVFHGQTQLGADAVGAGHQHRVLVALGQGTERAEAAQAAHHFRAQGSLGYRADALDQVITGIDVHAGVAVRQRPFLFAHGRLQEGEGALF